MRFNGALFRHLAGCPVAFPGEWPSLSTQLPMRVVALSDQLFDPNRFVGNLDAGARSIDPACRRANAGVDRMPICSGSGDHGFHSLSESFLVP
jgi:hypothetical protein